MVLIFIDIHRTDIGVTLTCSDSASLCFIQFVLIGNHCYSSSLSQVDGLFFIVEQFSLVLLYFSRRFCGQFKLEGTGISRTRYLLPLVSAAVDPAGSEAQYLQRSHLPWFCEHFTSLRRQRASAGHRLTPSQGPRLGFRYVLAVFCLFVASII